MRRVRWHRAAALREVLELLRDGGDHVRLIAGGTDLIIALRAESPARDPLRLVDLWPLKDLAAIEIASGSDGDFVRVGALATHTDLQRHPDLRRCAPLLAAAAASVGSPQIRNRGTIGGNLCTGSP
ncbi:MAG: hypothetical protein GF355_10865, partial [Candidatus Eisenbacteria bacterium]|nr:hypothetical protein [Candidatus Eisenbacteria bacterium]